MLWEEKSSDAHLHACLDLGITLTGTNAEVLLGLRKYQCFGKGDWLQMICGSVATFYLKLLKSLELVSTFILFKTGD